MSNGDAPKQDVSVLALERTVLAGERTLLALVRTGFMIAGLGSLVTALLGRHHFADWVIGLFSTLFVVVGIGLVQVGLQRFRDTAEEFDTMQRSPTTVKTVLALMVVLQFTLAALLVCYLIALFTTDI